MLTECRVGQHRAEDAKGVAVAQGSRLGAVGGGGGRGRKRTLESLELAECSMGWQWMLKVEMESKHRLREWQMVHVGGPHSGSFELPAS